MSRWTRPRLARLLGRGFALTLFGGTFLVLLVSGAGAFWSGSATGSGTAGTAGTVTVILSSGTPANALVPGATADVVLTVSNPNTASLRISSLTLDPSRGTGGYAVDNDHSACPVSALSFSTQTNGGSGWTIPGKVGTDDATTSLTLAGAVALDTDAANACQGATFSVYLVTGP